MGGWVGLVETYRGGRRGGGGGGEELGEFGKGAGRGKAGFSLVGQGGPQEGVGLDRWVGGRVGGWGGLGGGEQGGLKELLDSMGGWVGGVPGRGWTGSSR